MTTSNSPQPARPLHAVAAGRDSQAILRANRSREIVLGVVGHLGSGTSAIAKDLADALEKRGYAVHRVRATEIIEGWARDAGRNPTPRDPSSRKGPAWVAEYQEHGDAMRLALKDNAAVARLAVERIAEARAGDLNVTYVRGNAVKPDDKRRAFVIDSIRHDEEVRLLRELYGDGFALLGIVCEESVREERLLDNLLAPAAREERRKEIQALMVRDAKDPARKYGQHVRDAFELADYFLDNTPKNSDPDCLVPDQLGRLIDLFEPATKVIRPTTHETAMHHAWSARLRSACLSRQVGAALTDGRGEILTTGTNEVPRFLGGPHGETLPEPAGAGSADGRCWVKNEYCSNVREQLKIAESLLELFPEIVVAHGVADARAMVMSSQVGSLIEFSRAVHAEMDAVLGAARSGRSTVGGRLYSTTYPCHGCARNLVSAGIIEVQYIEAYPKSKALLLHDDSIAVQRKHAYDDEGEQIKVLFHPFTGVAPRLYQRVFLENRRLKDATGALEYGDSPTGGAWGESRFDYASNEAQLLGETP